MSQLPIKGDPTTTIENYDSNSRTPNNSPAWVLNRALLDDKGDYLTNDGIILQHNLATEDDMLYTEFMPARKNNTLLRSVIDSDVFQDVIRFEEELVAGTYSFIVNAVVNSPDTNDSLFWKIASDTGLGSDIIFSFEAADTSNVVPINFPLQYEHAGGVMGWTLSMHKEDSGHTDCKVLGASVAVHRVA